MVEKDQIIKEKMDHSGIFDFSAFYSFAHQWFKNELYGVFEEKYSEKVSANGRDISIEWKAIKKLSDYFRIEHGIKMNITGLSDVEVEIDGKRKKMNKGKIEIEIKGILLKDAESKWDTQPMFRMLREIYNKYIIPARVEALEDKVIADVKTWKEEMKAYLELTGKR
ncbi:MAG: hypothetical protein MUF61_01575 [archaeon]|jgi:hypothetical protein|nr:hypothetical protein [archaeon]